MFISYFNTNVSKIELGKNLQKSKISGIFSDKTSLDNIQ